MSSSQRSKIRYAPPEPGIRARVLLRFLREHDGEAWPVRDAIAGAGLAEQPGWDASVRLLQLGLIRRQSADTLIRVTVTAAGRRFRLDPPRTRPSRARWVPGS